VLALRGEPPLRGADNAFLEDVQTERATLLTFYDAGLAAYRGDRDAWQADRRRVTRDDETNPYYRWFVGAGR
jgi:spermidine synthase